MQIVLSVEQTVQGGNLPKGYRLPTVRSLAEKLGVSKGTVKHAYDILEERKVVEIIQGKGTFVLMEQMEECTASVLDAVTKTALSALRRLAHDKQELALYNGIEEEIKKANMERLKIALISCCPEFLSITTKQLLSLYGAVTEGFLLEEIKHTPSKVDDSFDLILATSESYNEIRNELPALLPLTCRVDLQVADEVKLELMALPKSYAPLVYCQSYVYFATIVNQCLNHLEHMPAVVLAKYNTHFLHKLAATSCLILPENFADFITKEEIAAISEFTAKGGNLLICRHAYENGLFRTVSRAIAVKAY